MKGYSRQSKPSCGFPKSFHRIGEVQHLIEQAVAGACGLDAISVLETGGSVVKICPNWMNSADFQCSCAISIFKRYHGRKEKCSKQDENKCGFIQSDTMQLTTVSEYGLTRHRNYENAADVAQVIIDCCLDIEGCGDFIVDMRLDSNNSRPVNTGGGTSFTGNIKIVTKSHIDWQLSQNRVFCSHCGSFYQSGRAYRMHQVKEHSIEYGDAQRAVRELGYQMIPYNPDQSIFSILRAACEQEQAQLLSENPIQDGDEIPLCEALDACRRGDLKRVRELATTSRTTDIGASSTGAAVDRDHFDPLTTVDRNGCDALCWAAGSGHLMVCKYLVEDWNVPLVLRGKLKRKRHPFHWAARNGHIDVMEWFVCELGVNVNIGTEDGTTALHYAVWSGHLLAVQWLVEVGRCSVVQLNSYGCNASQWCALNGNVTILEYLFDRGLDVSVINHNGHSALHKAAMKGQRAICEWLLLPAICTQPDCGYNGKNDDGDDDDDDDDDDADDKDADDRKTASMIKGIVPIEQQRSSDIGLNGKDKTTNMPQKDTGISLKHMDPDRDGYTPELFAVHNGFVELSKWLEQQRTALRKIMK